MSQIQHRTRWHLTSYSEIPVLIGPLCKNDFLATLNTVGSDEAGLANAFPDLQTNAFGFSMDPTEPNRVWYFERPRGTFLGAIDHPVVGRVERTGAEYIGPPEARSVIVDEEGKMKYKTVSYVVDRFTADTIDGARAVFGMNPVMGEKLDDTVGFRLWFSCNGCQVCYLRAWCQNHILARKIFHRGGKMNEWDLKSKMLINL